MSLSQPNGARTRQLFGTDGVRGVANVEPMTSETALRLGRAVAHVLQERPPAPPQDRHRQGHAPLRLHARDRDGIGHLLDGRRRAAGRPDADARHRLPHAQPARRRRRRHLRIAQPVSGQRHQVLLERRASSSPTRSSSRSSAWCSTTSIDHLRPTAERHRQGLPHRRRARPLQRLREEHLPARADARRPARRRRLRQRRRATASRPRCSRSSAPTVIPIGVRARRREHQPRLRRDLARRARSARCIEQRAHVGVALDGDADRCHPGRRVRRGRRRRRAPGDRRASSCAGAGQARASARSSPP